MRQKTKLEKIKSFLTDKKYRCSFLNSYGFYKHLSDEKLIRKLYKTYFGREIDLENPKTFNEKQQWLKLYDRKAIYTTMVDKYEAKNYVAERIGTEYIIPTYGVWDSFDEIDFDALPNQFVLKCTHDSGGLVIVRDKKKLDKKAAKAKIERSLKTNYYYHGREWPYKNVKPRILAETYMEDDSGCGLRDYKFYCFGGVPKFLYISEGLEDHSTAHISFVTCDWQFAPYERSDYCSFDVLPPKPSRFDLMLELAAKLSQGTDFLRVDLYEVNGQVYFSELTFSPCGGFMPFKDEKYDYEIGEMLSLTKQEVK